MFIPIIFKTNAENKSQLENLPKMIKQAITANRNIDHKLDGKFSL